MAAKSIEEFQTNQQTMYEELGPTPETLGDDLLSQPIQGFYMSVKEYYDQFCIWISKLEAINSVHYDDDDEWYVVDFIFGLKMDLMERVFRHKGIRRVSEAFHWAETEENSGKNGADVVFDGMSNPESKHCDEFQEAEDAGNDKSGDLMVHLEADHKKIVSLNPGRDVLDELPEPASTAYKLIDDDLDVCSELKSKEASYTQDFGDSEYGAMLYKSTGLVFTGLNLYPEKLIPVEFVMVKAAYQVFHKMPQLTFVWSFKEIFGAKSLVPLIDCVPKVFDPGDGIDPVVTVGWRFNEMKSFGPKARKDVPRNYKLDDGFALNMILTFIFDPGGSLKHRMCCDSINSERINAEAIVVKYVYGAAEISSKHGSWKVLHWDKVVGGSESKTVCYPFMEQSKVTDPNKSQYIAILLYDHNVTVNDLIETLCAMRREGILILLDTLKHGVDNRLSFFKTLDVMGDEITLSKCWSFLFGLSGNSFALRSRHLRIELSLSWGRLFVNTWRYIDYFVEFEVPGAQRIFILEIDSWRRRTIFGYATYVCSFFMRGVIAVYLPSYVPTTLSFVLVIVQTDIIGVILGIYTMLSIEVSKAIDPEKDRDEFIVLMGDWEGTDEDIGSIFLELLSRMSPTNAVCNLTECKDDSPVTLRRAEFIMHILGVSFAFKILETILFISCLRYAVEYRKKALETTFGEFTVRKYLVFIYGPGRWYNSTLQRLDMADPILLVIKQSFGYETWVVCISKWTQSVLASLTDQDGIRELKSKQLNDQLLKCTYVSFQDLFSFTWAPIVISIVYIGEKHWVTKFLSNGNGSNKMNIGVCSNGYDGVTIVEFHVFIWDPGQNVNSLYILEDKDVVERVGKDMVLMDTTLATRGYDHEVQMSCLDTMRLGKFELGLLASDLKHFKQYYGYDDILDNILRPKRFKLLILLDPDSDILDVSRGLPTGFGDWAAASLISSTLELEYFVWDVGSFTSVLQASWKEFGVNFHFTTLRTRWLLRGRICHDIAFLNKIYMYFRIVYLAGYDVT